MKMIMTVVLLVPLFAGAQINLVPNGDFESRSADEFPCSWLVDDDNINDYINNWFTPIGTSTDVMSTYARPNCWAHAPETGEGTMAPHSGNVMIGFINYSPDGGCQPEEWHEYLSVELTDSLVPGNLYCIEFWVALGGHSYYATNNIGALLTTSAIERGGCAPILYKPQVNIDRVVKNTTEWLRIEASFFADSAYRYLTIGNFFKHEETMIEEQFIQPAKKPEGSTMPTNPVSETAIEASESTDISHLAYYFIDDVKLYLCPSASISVPKPAPEVPQPTPQVPQPVSEPSVNPQGPAPFNPGNL